MSMIGKTLGAYQIVSELGRGGMAVVYKAFQPSLNRYVALKVLPEYFQHDPEFVARFRQEAQAAAQLSHPNIVVIHDIGEQAGVYYIAMEYLEGGSLRDRLAQTAAQGGAYSPQEALSVLEQVGSALDYAHSRGLIHRDVKPANILFGADGRPRLTDFGIARAADSARLTRTGVLLGTPEYMSPEQAQGESIDRRSDLYALGVVAYEMLTGRVPFQGNTPHATLHSVVYEAPPPPRQVKPGLSPEVEAALLQALAKRPEARFQQAAALAGALRPALSVQAPARAAAGPPAAQPAVAAASRRGIGAMPPGQAVGPAHNNATPPPPSQPRAKSRLWVLGGAIVLAAATLVVLLVLALRPKQPAAVIETAGGAGPAIPQSGSTGCPDYPPAFSLVTGMEMYAPPSLEEPAARRWFADPAFGTCLVRVTDPTHDLPPDDPSTGIANEYSRVQSFNADGSRLLLRGTEGTWYLYDAQTLQPIGPVPVFAEPRWDADNPNLLYFSDGTQLLSLDVTGGEPRLVHDFAADLPGFQLSAVWTRYEGRPSRDTRYWGLMAEDADWLPVAFIVYDRQADRVTIRDMRGVPGIRDDVDHVTISPLGTYFLASFNRACEQGTLGDDANPCGLMVYDRALANGRSLLRIIGHYDVALDAQGREVLIYQEIDHDQISMLDLETGAVTPLWDIDFSHTAIGLHFSGLAYDRPGWAVVSTYDGDPTTYTWMDDQVLAVELKAGGHVVRLAYNRSVVSEGQELDYWAEPHATTNADLTRVIFTTDWGRSGTGQVETFMIALPPDWPERLAAEPAFEAAMAEPLVESTAKPAVAMPDSSPLVSVTGWNGTMP